MAIYSGLVAVYSGLVAIYSGLMAIEIVDESPFMMDEWPLK